MGKISKETAEEFAHPHEVKSKIILEGGEGLCPETRKVIPNEQVEEMFQDAEEITLNIEVKGKGEPIKKTIALDEIDSEFEVIGIENGEAKIKFSLKGSYSMFIGENWNLKFKVT